MEYPRIIINGKKGNITVSCGLDIIPLDVEAVRMKIREIYNDNKICISRHKAVEQILREELLEYAKENGLIENFKPFSNLPQNLQRLLRVKLDYDMIKFTYDKG